MTYDPNVREAAEKILDGLYRVLDDEMSDMPTEQRFDLLVLMLLRTEVSRTVMAAALVTALERLHLKETLDEQLGEEELG